MDKKTAIRIVNELSMLGIKAINWTGGGEPLVNQDFCDIARFTVHKRIQQGLYTNGSLIDKDLMFTILSTQEWVKFSIDAGTRETYEKIKGIDDFDKVIQNIKDMVARRNEDFYSIMIGMDFVITPDNYQEILKFSELVKELGVDYGGFRPATENALMSADWWKEKAKPLLEIVFADNPKLVINRYKYDDIMESNIDQPYVVCYGHQFCPCIGADSKVYLCNHFRGREEYVLGDLHKENFRKIWDSYRRKEVIKSLDISACPKLCKNNEINKILYLIKNPKRELHHNFL
jgi:radical SAM protein with 4Fe4S-binding SPASM domain